MIRLVKGHQLNIWGVDGAFKGIAPKKIKLYAPPPKISNPGNSKKAKKDNGNEWS